MTRIHDTAVVLLVLALVASGLAGAAGAASGGSTGAAEAPAQSEQAQSTPECAAAPPDDGADPESDVVGWENGRWYDESLDVTQEDGVGADERAALVNRTMARVEAVRCVEFDETVPVSVIDREQFRQEELERNVSEGLRTFDNAKFEALFLVNESADSIAVQNRNRGTGVLGYYSPEEDQIVVVAESAEQLRISELTLAHELVHAWQDQEFNLTSDDLDVRLRDLANARSGLVEGDASYTETLYEQRCGEDWNCLETEGPEGDLANIGVYTMMFQPYSDGPSFVRFVRNVGGWDAVNALYDRPPASAEQVIHPERYGSDPPTNVSLDDTATGEWERVTVPDRPDYGEVGESALMSMFVYPYYHSQGETELVPTVEWFNFNESGEVDDFDPLNYESDFTEGWDGDRLHVYQNETGELAYVWRLAWDSPQDAQQFADGYRQLLDYWGAERVDANTYRIPEGGFADAFHVRVDGTTVTIVNAPTVDQLSEVRSGVSVSGDTGGETTAESDGAADSATVNVSAGTETTAADA